MAKMLFSIGDILRRMPRPFVAISRLLTKIPEQPISPERRFLLGASAFAVLPGVRPFAALPGVLSTALAGPATAAIAPVVTTVETGIIGPPNLTSLVSHHRALSRAALCHEEIGNLIYHLDCLKPYINRKGKFIASESSLWDVTYAVGEILKMDLSGLTLAQMLDSRFLKEAENFTGQDLTYESKDLGTAQKVLGHLSIDVSAPFQQVLHDLASKSVAYCESFMRRNIGKLNSADLHRCRTILNSSASILDADPVARKRILGLSRTIDMRDKIVKDQEKQREESQYQAQYKKYEDDRREEMQRYGIPCSVERAASMILGEGNFCVTLDRAAKKEVQWNLTRADIQRFLQAMEIKAQRTDIVARPASFRIESNGPGWCVIALHSPLHINLLAQMTDTHLPYRPAREHASFSPTTRIRSPR